MNKITVKQAAEKWGVSVRWVQDMCKRGEIVGAQQWGRTWMIPENAIYPYAPKIRNTLENLPLIRKSPFLDMTDLYSMPGTADKSIETLVHHPEAQALFTAEIAYSRGEIDKVYEYANYFLNNHTGFYAVISGGMLLGLCAMWKGDVALWQKAKKHLYEAPWETAHDRDIISLSIASTDLSIRNTNDFPDWFCRGRFQNLPTDSHPAARVFYVKYLLVSAQELAAGNLKLEDARGLGLMRTLPFIIEPMIAQAVVDNTIMAEIYLRILCAIVYYQIGDRANAILHLDKAIELCLPDRLYGPLVEHRRQLGLFLDERLMLADAKATYKVKELHKQLLEGWTKLHNSVMGNLVSSKLSAREREVARLAAFGLSNAQIALQLHLTETSVKSLLKMARNKTGATDRSDLGVYI